MTASRTAARPRVLVVVNSKDSRPRRLATWLGEAGVEVVPALGADGLPETLEGFDGLVLLGGGLMPDDYERAPWLRAERRLTEQAIADDLPTLGICLGAQVIADVAGGEVRARTGPKERGATPIHATTAGRRDALLSAFWAGSATGTAPMIENHEDMITRLPESAVLLASSDAVENQAFVIGAHVRGVQFHPEASAADLANWDDAALRGEGRDLAELIAAAQAVDGENTAASRRLIDAFAREVRQRAGLTALDDPHVAELDTYVAALDGALAGADTRLAPAVLLAAFDARGVIAWRALGEPRGAGSVTTRDTVFRIASMSKSFLAAAALALVDEGRLDLDRPVSDYVPYARFRFRGREERVTVRELLANRSGMPEDNAWGDRQLGASREEIAALAAAGFELTELPGVRYQYSNLGMSLVGRAIEAITGNQVEHEVRRRFIEPLGLAHTRYAAEEYPRGGEPAQGFRTFDAGAGFSPEPYVGSGALACIGALFSTVDDIAAWAAFLCSGFAGPVFGDATIRPELLSARSRREMQRAHTPIPIEAGDPFRELDALGYGLGLVAERDRRFGRIAQHSGGLPGFSSHMRWHLDSGVGVVAFGNSDAFRTERLAADAHARILVAAGASASAATPWPATLAAAERIDRMLRAGEPFAAAAEVLAPNLLRDVPEEVRRRRLDAELARVGEIAPQAPLAERILSFEDAAQLRWRVVCARGALRCDIRMIGLPEPLVQSLVIERETAGVDAAPSEEGAAR